MATEKFTNNGASLLDGAINNSVTSLVVDSGASFPAGPQFRIKIDDEIMLVTAVAGTTFTVTRGVDSTSAASHLDNAPVTHIYTAGALNQSIADVIQRGAYASLPAVEKAGRQYMCTDFPVTFYDDGSNWHPYYSGYPATTPSDSGFSWVNQGSAVIDTSGYGLFLSCVSNGGYTSYRMRVKSHSSPRKYTVGFVPGFVDDTNAGNGLVFRESGTGKFVTFNCWCENNNDFRVYIEKWNSATSFNGNIKNWKFNNPGNVIWFQFEDNGTNIYWRTSRNGIDFVEATNASRTNFMSGGPDQIGFFVDPSSQYAQTRIVSWKEQ